MALKDKLLKSYQTIGKRMFGIGKDEDLGMLFRHGADTQQRNFLNSYQGIVYACVSAISEEVGKYDPVLQQFKGNEKVEKQEHEFKTLLQNPQPDMPNGLSKYELLEATQSFIELTGECFWYKVLGNTTGKPKSIHILRPDRMGIDIDKNGEINGYYLIRNKEQNIPFEIEEIEHFKMFNPHNPYRGMGTIEAANDYIGVEENTRKYTKNFFKNNAALSGVLSVKGEVSKNAFNKFVRQWRDKYEGVDNAGKVALVRETDAEFTKIGLGLDELDMTALRKMTLDEVLMMFRVPRSIIGLSDDSGLGRASVETLEYIFNKRVVDPKMSRIDAVIQRMVSRHWAKDNLIVEHRNVIPEDKEFELQNRKAGVDQWLTRNEIRGKDGLEPKDGGEDLRAPVSSMPISFDQEEEQDSGETTESVRTISLKKKDSDDEPEELDTDLDYERKENFRLSLMRNQKKYERKYKRTVNDILKDQEQEVLDKLQALAASATKDMTQFTFNLSDANKVFDEKIFPVLLALYQDQGSLALLFAGDEETTFETSRDVEPFIHESTKRMAKNYNEDTLTELSATLSEGTNNGESLSKLKKRVTGVYQQARGYRAERIARTETLKASNNATNLAYKQTGYVKEKEWFANPNACEFCRPLNGTKVGLDDNFKSQGETIQGDEGGERTLDYEDVKTPPVHVQCRCTIIPVR